MTFVQSITAEQIAALPSGAFEGRIDVIDSRGPLLDEAVEYLKAQTVIGFDTETKPTFVPGQRNNGVALLQLSGPDRAFLFRLNRIGLPFKVARLLSNANIIKVGAAVKDDIRGLKKHTDFKEKSFVDLQALAAEYGITDKAVKKLSGIILGIHISKAQQCSNWEADPLNDAQRLYAATDAWVCREMYLKLISSEK